jgi:hypothetical protein
MDLDEEESAMRVWRRALASLLASERTLLDAVDGANIVLDAWMRRRDEAHRRGGTPDRCGGT